MNPPTNETPAYGDINAQRVRGRFQVCTRERREAPQTLVEKLARVGLVFDRYGRLVICKPDQEMHHASHG